MIAQTYRLKLLIVCVSALLLCWGCGEDDDPAVASNSTTISNGTNTSNGTSSTSNGTTRTSNGTTNTSNSTTATSNGTTRTSNSTTSTSNSTTSTSNSTTSTSNGTTNTSNGTTNTSNSTTANPIAVMCEALCSYSLSCLSDFCSEEIEEMFGDECIERCIADPPTPSERDEALATPCEDYQAAACDTEELQGLCMCTITPTPQPPGGPCTSDEECDGGDLSAYCQLGEDPETGASTGYVEGYCVRVGCEENSECGEGNFCVFQPPNNMVCYAGCNPMNGSDVCRGGYGCWSLFGDDAVCLPSCTEDADCGAGGSCDVDGTEACL